ncbi:MAG: hypothetical protein ACR2HT_04185 [Pyrinomonadaceae bacterium]|jgi:hypothetical protein
MSKPIGRTFYFEKELWARLDEDAKRCLRSSTKQMEAILKTYFDVEDVDLSKAGLEMLGEIMPRSNKGIKVLPGAAQISAKKKAS